MQPENAQRFDAILPHLLEHLDHPGEGNRFLVLPSLQLVGLLVVEKERDAKFIVLFLLREEDQKLVGQVHLLGCVRYSLHPLQQLVQESAKQERPQREAELRLLLLSKLVASAEMA